MNGKIVLKAMETFCSLLIFVDYIFLKQGGFNPLLTNFAKLRMLTLDLSILTRVFMPLFLGLCIIWNALNRDFTYR